MQKVITVTESKSVRKKLMAATSMLLVAVIMLVSATYAWFTLSTAPEITGITTAVGANGNLEIALATTDTWGSDDPTSNVGDSMAVNDVDAANITWGNLIDVSDTSIYGLDKITLYPSSLNYTTDAKTHVNTGALLKIPEYGTDGRVATLVANGVTGIYDGTSGFAVSNEMGVRAIGVASALTDRQLAYRSVLSTISTQMLAAQGAAQSSLKTNGSTFANIIVDHSMSNDSYTSTDLAAIKSAIASLDSAADNIKAAIDAAIVGYAASKAGQATIDDTVFEGFADAIATGYTISGTTLTTTVAGETVTVTLPDAFATMYTKYTTMRNNITAAETAANNATAESDGTYTWASISAPLNYLVDSDNVTVNDYTVAQIQGENGIANLVQSYVAKNGISVQLGTGAGVYADIADFCGDYSEGVTINDLTYNGTNFGDVPATMTTKSSVVPSYLASAKTAVSGAGSPESTVTTDSKITDYYGYALDLLFRTNAEGSTLQLQVDPTQRIYEDSTNEETQGSGSNMTFKSTTSGFSTADVQNLMACIRVVFLDGSSEGEIIGTAKLDMDNVTTTSDGSSKADLMLYTTAEDGTETFLDEDKQDLLLLNKNQKAKVTAIVYLDGENITNADVANAVSSMTGSMNLQFTSTATLVPMENAALKGATTE